MAIKIDLVLPAAWARRAAANEVDVVPAGPAGPGASRAMRDIDYRPETRVLRVTFASGNVYEIDDVPPAIVEGLRAAPSKGRYFHEWIRDRFVARRIS